MIFYLHGLNGSGASQKATWLRTHLAPVPVLAPTYSVHRADGALAFLRVFVRETCRSRGPSKCLFIGSSLGGYYAPLLAAEFGGGMVLLNPSTRPNETLPHYLGPQHNDATGEDYVLTMEMVTAFAKYRAPRCNPAVPTLLLLDAADDVLDYRHAEAFYRGCGRTVVYAGGSHRFDHLDLALPEIRSLYDSLAEVK
jgi:uncharacterized protein